MEIDMKELLEQEFSDDPVYREIHINHLEGYLYNEKILGMHPETTYSTIETGQIIGRKDSTIRNYFRTELLDYINPEKNGKFYRLNYISVFKLHMLSLLVDKAGKSTADICFFLGITPLVGAGNNQYSNQNNNMPSVDNLRIQEDISQMKQLMVLQSINTNLADKKTSLLQLQLQMSNNNTEINALKKDLELMDINHQNKVLENKYYRVLDYSLKNTVTKKEEQKGLFKRLFKSSEEGTSEEEIDQVLKNAKAVADKEKQEFANQEKSEIIKKIEEKKKVNELLQEKIEEKQQEISKLEGQMSYLNNNPDELRKAAFMNLLNSGNVNNQWQK